MSRPIFIAPSEWQLIDPLYYRNEVWLQAKAEMLPSRKWGIAVFMLYDYEDRLFTRAGKPFVLGDLSKLWADDGRWMRRFLRADVTGTQPLTYAKDFYRLKVIDLTCRIKDWRRSIPGSGKPEV